MKPLLPAIDAAGVLREAGFALLLRDRRPVELAAGPGRTGRLLQAMTQLGEALLPPSR
jgi:hypothetical protein